MTNEQLKDLLRGDIRDTATWERVEGELLRHTSSTHRHEVARMADDVWGRKCSDDTLEKAWWVRRQAWRQVLGVYPEMPETLAQVCTALPVGQTLPHASPIDKTQIAFTASTADGERDKVTRTTIGRWLRRWCPVLTDAYIQRVEQRHAAELSDELKVATTPDDVEYVYRNMAGDSGCMRHGASHWQLPHHPSIVYASPETGLGVAYVGEIGGPIISRAVVYVNPDDPQDKRYVRVYGAPQLRARLEHAGYRCAALTGARLPRLDAGRGDRFILPYLDGPGGAQGSSEGCSVVWLASDPEHLRVCDGEPRRSANARTTAGWVKLVQIDNTQSVYTCALTGREYDSSLGECRVRYVTLASLESGTQEWVNLAAATKASQGEDPAVRVIDALAEGGGVATLCVPSREYEQLVRRAESGEVYLEADRQTLLDAGALCQLDPEWYGLGRVISCNQATTCAVSGRGVTMDDAVLVYVDGGLKLAARQVVTVGRKGQFQALAPHRGRKAYAPKDCGEVVATRSGAKVIAGVHNVVPTLQGGWEFERRCAASYDLAGRTLAAPSGERGRGACVQVCEQIAGNLVAALGDDADAGAKFSLAIERGFFLPDRYALLEYRGSVGLAHGGPHRRPHVFNSAEISAQEWVERQMGLARRLPEDASPMLREVAETILNMGAALKAVAVSRGWWVEGSRETAQSDPAAPAPAPTLQRLQQQVATLSA